MPNLAEPQTPNEPATLNRTHSAQKLWKLERVADVLDMPLSTAYEHARTGLFDSFIVRIGRRVRVNPEKFQTWLESGGATLAGGWKHDE